MIRKVQNIIKRYISPVLIGAVQDLQMENRDVSLKRSIIPDQAEIRRTAKVVC